MAYNKPTHRGIIAQLNGRRNVFSLRTAPMIDVIFLLLIFFLVSAKWRPLEDFLPFELPVAMAGESYVGRVEPLTIRIVPIQAGCTVQIGRFGTVEINDGTVEKDLAVLMGQIKQCMLAEKRFTSDLVEIVCDERLKWDHLAKIYNVLAGAGLTDIIFPMTGHIYEPNGQ